MHNLCHGVSLLLTQVCTSFQFSSLPKSYDLSNVKRKLFSPCWGGEHSITAVRMVHVFISTPLSPLCYGIILKLLIYAILFIFLEFILLYCNFSINFWCINAICGTLTLSLNICIQKLR